MAGDPYFDDVICLLHLDATGATASDFPAVVGPDWDSGNGATLTNDNDPVWGNALNNCTEDSSNIKATSGWTSVPDMSAFTLDIDYTPDDFNDIAALFCWGNGSPPSGDMMRFYINADSTIRFTLHLGGSNIINITTTDTLTVGTRHKLRLVFSLDTIYIFIDGILSISAAYTPQSLPTPDEARIGFMPSASDGSFWRSRGDIDEVRLTNAVRSTTNYTPATEPFPNFKDVPQFSMYVKSPTGAAVPILPIQWGQIVGSLINQTDVVNAFVAAGYGGLRLSASVAFTLDATWRTVPFDAESYAAPKAITQDTANNALIFNSVGTFNVNINLTLLYAEAQAGREVKVRVYNITSDTSGEDIIFIGRNQGGLNYRVTMPVEIVESEVGNSIVIQLSSDDSFSGVSIRAGNFLASSVSEYKG